MHQTDTHWPMHERVLQREHRMGVMMALLGVDQGAAVRQDHGRGFARAQTACLFCLTGAECERWLAGATDVAEPPSFCPNRAFFAAFMRPRAEARH